MVVRRMNLWLQAAVAAVQFLTRIPVPVSIDFTKETVARSVVFFPVAGALIGLIVSFAAHGLSGFLPAMPAAVIVLAVWIALSGGLHLDGWMDAADGLLSHRSRERMLDIMKDSRVGAMGVIAGVLLLLFKVAVLYELLADGIDAVRLVVLFTIPVWSRLAMTAAIVGWPFARGSEGMAALFNRAGVRHILGAAVVSMLIILTGLLPLEVAFYDIVLHVLATAAITALVCTGMAVWFRRKLGGLTGDTYGAINEGVEAVLLLGLIIG
ncbi:adenosylcobinamide-GDP ribazoletransferase [Paenibacillus tarimensis]